MELLLQDGMTLSFALAALVASVLLIEWMTARAGTMHGGRGATVGVLLALVCVFIISEIAGFVGTAYFAVPHVTGYGRAFSYAVLGLILYVPIRIYQLLRQRNGAK